MQYEIIKYKNHFHEQGQVKDEDKIYLENNFVPQSKSIIWDFNLEFWNHLEPFMNALGKDYKKSIGGTADANTNLIKYSAQRFASQIAALDNKSEEFYYLEMGAAGTDWARDFLQELINLKPKNLDKLIYVFTDFSKKVLESARHDLGNEYLGVKIEYFCLQNDYFDMEDKAETFKEKYAGKILRVHATNVYDNFPCDRILYDKGAFYSIKVRTYISKNSFEPGLIGLVKRLNDLSVNDFLLEARKHFANEIDFYKFWQDLWNFMKFDEQLVTTNVDESLAKLFDNFKEEAFEFSYSIEVEEDIKNKYELLVPNGCIEIIDIIVNDLNEYKNFLGPVKYDASIANYLNGPLLQASLKETFPNTQIQIKSLKDFGGKRNQTTMEIVKNEI